MRHVSLRMTDSKSHIILVSLGPASERSATPTGNCLSIKEENMPSHNTFIFSYKLCTKTQETIEVAYL